MTTCASCPFFDEPNLECANVDSDRWSTHADEPVCEWFMAPKQQPPQQQPAEQEESLDERLARIRDEHGRAYRDWHER